jgi:hypothetical protein
VLRWQTSVPLEGWTPPRARFRLAQGSDAPSGQILPRSRTGRHPRVRLRLAQGLDTPSSGVPPRSKASRARCSNTYSPDRGIQCTEICRHQGQRRIHATPLTRLEITPRRCSANPLGEAIPAVVRYCAVRPVSALRHCAIHSCTAGAPHPRKRMAEPSKGDGRLFRARTGPCRDVRRISAVTISPV